MSGSLRIDVTSLYSNSLIIGNVGLGVLGSDIPASGQNGPSFLYPTLNLPADNNKEIRAAILTWPTAGTLFVYEDGSFSFVNAPDGSYNFTYQLYVDGVSTGSPSTVTLNVGPLPWAATATSQSTVTATITTSITMASSAFSVTTASADLGGAILLNAQAVIAASATASLTTDAASMIAAAISAASASGDLTTVIMLEAFATSIATGTGTLTVPGTGGIGPADRIVIKFLGNNPYELTLM